MKREVTGDIVVAKYIPPDKTEGGLHIPESAKSKEHSKLIVVDFGPYCENVEVGDKLIAVNGADPGVPWEDDDGTVYLAVQESSIWVFDRA